MYIEATRESKPPMVKYLRYFIIFLATCYGLMLAYNGTDSIYFSSEDNNVGFYSLIHSQKKDNQVVTFSNNIQSSSKTSSRSTALMSRSIDNNSDNFIMLQTENSEDEWVSSVDYSSLTKSEILDYQKVLEEQIKEWEKNPSATTYSNLAKELEYSKEILNKGAYLYPYSQTDLDAVAYVIHREAGSTWLENRHRDLVGCVVRNRKVQGGINQDLTNPSYHDIINESGQYPYKSWDINTSVIEDYCYESAVKVLEYKVECPDDLVWQATFEQGKTYEKFYDETLGTTTYFGRR